MNDATMLELSNGTKVWVLNPEELDPNNFNWSKAKLHRDNDLPAVEYSDGIKEWYQNGERHRDNDLPAVEYSDGSKEWWVNDKFIREEY